MNSRIVLALAVSAGVALLVTGIFYQVALRGGSRQTAEVTLADVVVAAKDLEVGARIELTDLRMDSWPSNRIPDGAFTEIESVVERVAVSRVLTGEPVLQRRLAAPGSGVGLATKVPDGMRAMSVRVDDVIGVAGFVMPEARVDVLITGRPGYSQDGSHVTKTILGNVTVLSAGEHLAPDSSGQPQKVQVVTLLLEPKQAEMVTLAQARGKLQLVLRNANDEEVAETTGVAEVELYGGRPTTINVARPRPLPPPAPVAVPPPAPQVEMIRGNRRTIETIDASSGSD